jgi:hypothetical protein
MKMTAFGRFRGTFASFGVDTLFVLFLLAVELGRARPEIGLDSMLLFVTMLMVGTMPYFLPLNVKKPAFLTWAALRIPVAAAGVIAGSALQNGAAGGPFSESLKYIPMSMLLIASMVSCTMQFYGLMRLRLAK